MKSGGLQGRFNDFRRPKADRVTRFSGTLRSAICYAHKTHGSRSAHDRIKLLVCLVCFEVLLIEVLLVVEVSNPLSKIFAASAAKRLGSRILPH